MPDIIIFAAKCMYAMIDIFSYLFVEAAVGCFDTATLALGGIPQKASLTGNTFLNHPALCLGVRGLPATWPAEKLALNRGHLSGKTWQPAPRNAI